MCVYVSAFYLFRPSTKQCHSFTCLTRAPTVAIQWLTPVPYHCLLLSSLVYPCLVPRQRPLHRRRMAPAGTQLGGNSRVGRSDQALGLRRGALCCTLAAISLSICGYLYCGLDFIIWCVSRAFDRSFKVSQRLSGSVPQVQPIMRLRRMCRVCARMSD